MTLKIKSRAEMVPLAFLFFFAPNAGAAMLIFAVCSRGAIVAMNLIFTVLAPLSLAVAVVVYWAVGARYRSESYCRRISFALFVGSAADLFFWAFNLQVLGVYNGLAPWSALFLVSVDAAFCILAYAFVRERIRASIGRAGAVLAQEQGCRYPWDGPPGRDGA